MYTVIMVIKSIHANKGTKLYIVYSINLVTQAWISFDQNNMIKLSFVGYSDERLAYIIIAFRWRCSRSNTETSKHLKLCTKKVEPSKDKLVKWAFFPFPLWIDKNTCFAFLVHSTSTFHCNPCLIQHFFARVYTIRGGHSRLLLDLFSTRLSRLRVINIFTE